MHRLHIKIFLWFWLAVIVVSATMVTLTALTHSRSDDDRRWREKYSPRVDLWARQEAHILRRNGSKELERYVGSFQADPGVLNYIFDADRREVLGREASPAVLQIVGSMGNLSSGSQHVDEAERIIAEKIVDARGTPYVVVVDFPEPTFLNRSLVELIGVDLTTGGADRVAMIRLAGIVAVAGMFCFCLARSIAAPIERLRSAARRIADEQLQTRIDPGVLGRRDELADLGRDFNRMAERIEGLVTAQRHLFADVSHALRSPLARLNVALGLARQRAEPAASEHLDRIERETERLNTLIGQLLAMARVDSGVDVERKMAFELGTIVDEVVADAEYEARTRRCSVVFDQRCECVVEGAPGLLRRAIENVVRNAVRHTAEMTRVEVTMDCWMLASGPHAAIQIRDRGPGVPLDAIESLFTPFHRIANARRDAGEGTGLGLAITRRTLEVHGGTATAANAPGGGLLVTLELPVRSVRPRPVAVAARAAG